MLEEEEEEEEKKKKEERRKKKKKKKKEDSSIVRYGFPILCYCYVMITSFFLIGLERKEKNNKKITIFNVCTCSVFY
jgi:hypothetical protein